MWTQDLWFPIVISPLSFSIASSHSSTSLPPSTNESVSYLCCRHSKTRRSPPKFWTDSSRRRTFSLFLVHKQKKQQQLCFRWARKLRFRFIWHNLSQIIIQEQLSSEDHQPKSAKPKRKFKIDKINSPVKLLNKNLKRVKHDFQNIGFFESCDDVDSRELGKFIFLCFQKFNFDQDDTDNEKKSW